VTHDGIGDRKTAGSATYAYDQAARLTTFTGVTTTFVWDNGGKPNILTDGTTSYLYVPGWLPIEQIGLTASSFVHDQIGSTLALLDGTGAVAGRYTYTPYGVASSSGSASTSLRYTGQYTDGESGLVYLRARYYDPGTALFISVDPLLDTTRTPYAYAGGNPLMYADRTGLSFWDSIGLGSRSAARSSAASAVRSWSRVARSSRRVSASRRSARDWPSASAPRPVRARPSSWAARSTLRPAVVVSTTRS
jgi:RHS repeat-associated protein